MPLNKPQLPRTLATMKSMSVQSNKIVTFLPWLLLISTTIIITIGHSFNPFTLSPSIPAAPSPSPSPSPTPSNLSSSCDLFTGRWVKEPRGSIYTNSTCPMMPDSKNCGKYGKDRLHEYWRWKPHGCELPRFEPEVFLKVVRGKKMGFVGDSLARNQMESLLCLLSVAETPVNTYNKEKGQLQTWYFPSYDFTLMVIWAQLLAESSEKIIDGKVTGAFDLHTDKINTKWAHKLPGMDYLVVSDGNWFLRKIYLHEGGELIGCIMCQEKNITDLGFRFAIQRVFRTAFEYISGCEECKGLVTLLRTYSPPHFEHGEWFTGGYCNRTQPLNDTEVNISQSRLDIRKIQLEEIKRVKEGERGNKTYGVLDVTMAMAMRADAHPGSHFNKKWVKNVNDCLHWCLPGPIDMWNDLLLEVIRNDSSSYSIVL